MKHPCKLCIVRAACSKICHSYETYKRVLVEIITFVSVVTSGCILIPLLFYCNHLISQGSEGAKLFIVLFWLSCFIISTIIGECLKVNVGVFSKVILAPIIVIFYVIAFSIRTIKYFDAGVAQR